MSISIAGCVSRKFIVGTRLWPPARNRASSPYSAFSSSACARAAGGDVAEGCGFHSEGKVAEKSPGACWRELWESSPPRVKNRLKCCAGKPLTTAPNQRAQYFFQRRRRAYASAQQRHEVRLLLPDLIERALPRRFVRPPAQQARA